jgi:hypothetical protein
MGQTYRAMLRGDRVDWIDPPPSREGDTEVQITLLRPDPEPDEVRRARRRSAVAALRELAAAGGISAIPDPGAWEREIRQDRPLPSREG